MNVKVLLGMGLLFLVILFIMLLNSSYALWNINLENVNKIKIVAGTLQYKIEGSRIVNNKLTIPGGGVEDIIIDIVSLNTINSNFVLYYEGSLPKDVTIGYIETPVEGTIGIVNTKQTFKLRITNASASDVTLTLGVQGGFTQTTVTLISGRNKLVESLTNLKWKYVYTGSSQEFIVPDTGYYKIELWGAQGGISIGGKGAYTSGYVQMTKGEKLYIYVGQQGLEGSIGINASRTVGQGAAATYNGGGKGGQAGGGSYPFASYRGGPAGGGATDVRLSSGQWNDALGFKNRIMVAGGGGGSSSGNAFDHNLGTGGLIGGAGFLEFRVHDYPSAIQLAVNARGIGGTQRAGAFLGSGGVGSNSGVPDYCHGHGGGGGGYVGGLGGNSTVGHCFIIGGGGGSSFMSGFAGSNAIESSTSLQSTFDTLHYSGKYFINGVLLEGNNAGNGKANIEYIGISAPKSNTKLNNVRYIKDCISGSNYPSATTYKYWKELQVIKNGKNIAKGIKPVGTSPEYNNTTYSYTSVTDGDILGSHGATLASGLQCITIDLGAIYDVDEISVWHWGAEYITPIKYNNHTLSIGQTNQAGTTNLETVLINNRSGSTETYNGFRFNAWE